MFLKENYVKSLQTCFIKQYFRIIPWGYFNMKQIFIAHFWEKLEIAMKPVRFVQSSWSFFFLIMWIFFPNPMDQVRMLRNEFFMGFDVTWKLETHWPCQPTLYGPNSDYNKFRSHEISIIWITTSPVIIVFNCI